MTRTLKCPNCGCEENRHMATTPECKLGWYRCAGCDMVWNKDYNLREYNEDYFTGCAGDYDDCRMKRVATGMRRVLIARMVSKKGRLLDIGCSMGYFVEAAGKLGYDAEGVEISKYAAEYARKKGLKVNCGDALNLSYPDNTFSVVTYMNSLEHVGDLDKSLSEAYRVLAPGGCVMIVGPNANYWKMLTKQSYHGWEKPDHCVTFTYKFLRNYLTARDFEIVNPPVYSFFRFLLNAIHLDKNVTVLARKKAG